MLEFNWRNLSLITILNIESYKHTELIIIRDDRMRGGRRVCITDLHNVRNTTSTIRYIYIYTSVYRRSCQTVIYQFQFDLSLHTQVVFYRYRTCAQTLFATLYTPTEKPVRIRFYIHIHTQPPPHSVWAIFVSGCVTMRWKLWTNQLTFKLNGARSRIVPCQIDISFHRQYDVCMPSTTRRCLCSVSVSVCVYVCVQSCIKSMIS